MEKIKFIYIIFAFVLIFSCKSNKETEENTEHEILPEGVIEFSAIQYESSGIVLDSLSFKQLSKTISVNGIITVPPQSYATVCSSFGGFVKSSTLMPGSYVTRGQVLATIENVEFVDLQQNYLETKSKLIYAEIEYERQKALNEGNVNSVKTFQQAELEYNTLKAQLNGLKQKLTILGINYEKLTVDNIRSVLPLISPISGYIKTVNINIGKYIQPSDVLFEIVNTSKFTLELIAFEKDLMNINEGQNVSFTIPNQLGTTYEATVLQVGKVLDEDKTANVYATIDNAEYELIAGMYVNAKIDAETTESVCLPSESIVQFDEKFYIFAFKENAMEDGKPITLFEIIEIEKGIEENGYTEIIFLNNIEYSKMQFVVKGAYKILSKYKNSGEMSC